MQCVVFPLPRGPLHEDLSKQVTLLELAERFARTVFGNDVLSFHSHTVALAVPFGDARWFRLSALQIGRSEPA